MIEINPGAVRLAQWRAVFAGGSVTLAGDAQEKIAASAAAVGRILARGEPVYGINTGFGKLACLRIEPADLLTLQSNIVLSHAAGVGAPSPVPVKYATSLKGFDCEQVRLPLVQLNDAEKKVVRDALSL